MLASSRITNHVLISNKSSPFIGKKKQTESLLEKHTLATLTTKEGWAPTAALKCGRGLLKQYRIPTRKLSSGSKNYIATKDRWEKHSIY